MWGGIIVIKMKAEDYTKNSSSNWFPNHQLHRDLSPNGTEIIVHHWDRNETRGGNIAISVRHVRATTQNDREKRGARAWGASGGSCRGVLAWPRVISNDVSPLAAHPLGLWVASAARVSHRLEQHGKIARARSMLITRITSLHACLLFSCSQSGFNSCWLHTPSRERRERREYEY